MENNIIIAPNKMEDFIWMSYRYCIGRHTGAAANHAETIHKLLVNNPDLLSEERKEFTAKDIRQSINDVINWKNNVTFGFTSRDVFSELLYSIDQFHTETHKYNWHVYSTESVEIFPRTEAVEPWESFDHEYTDLIGWVKLANFLDKSCHKMVVFQWNGETYEQECYPFPLKKDNGTYSKVWIALESNLNKTEWMGEEHIVEIKEL
jgi:hypothetical protein